MSQLLETSVNHDYGNDVALIVVDVQNDFADPEGGLSVDGGQDVVDLVNAEIRAAREAGARVVFTQDWHPPSTPHFAKDGGDWPVHCVAETWGAEFHPRLDLGEDPIVVRKGVDGSDGYSGFSVRDPETGSEARTELGAILDERQVSSIVVVGLAGDVCVKETALDGRRFGYDVAVPLAATRLVDPQALDGLVRELEDAGVQVLG